MLRDWHTAWQALTRYATIALFNQAQMTFYQALVLAYVFAALAFGCALVSVKGYRGAELIGAAFLACTWPFWILFRFFVVFLASVSVL
jgi:hypothetical protein